MKKAEIGLIGLAVMGENLALNIAGKGFGIAVYNRTLAKIDDFLDRTGGLPVYGAYSLQELAEQLVSPRRIILMVKAGQAVDEMIEQLLPFLQPDDIIIDAGNSHFADSRRRFAYLAGRGIRFLGMGVSGGEEGALKGPSMMPGGDRAAYEILSPLLMKIAAQAEGEPCVDYIGADGAGHYVKTIHNGIEYADMQLISEAYLVLREILGLSAEELADIFDSWNKSELESYLVEITANIFRVRDQESGLPLVDMVLDAAGQKGTGRWTAESALELGVPAPTLAEAVFARCLSAKKEERLSAEALLGKPAKIRAIDRTDFIEKLRKALYAAKICAYAQGFALLQAAADEYGWRLDYGRIALLWRGGCIIRARLLSEISASFAKQPDLSNIMLAHGFAHVLQASQDACRDVVCVAKQAELSIPGFSSALDYYDGYRRGRSPANLIQAQRDYFGAHTYQRVDKEGVFHSQWSMAGHEPR